MQAKGNISSQQQTGVPLSHVFDLFLLSLYNLQFHLVCCHQSHLNKFGQGGKFNLSSVLRSGLQLTATAMCPDYCQGNIGRLALHHSWS